MLRAVLIGASVLVGVILGLYLPYAYVILFGGGETQNHRMLPYWVVCVPVFSLGLGWLARKLTTRAAAN